VAFVQVVEFRTNNVDAMRELSREYERATEGKRTARRAVLTADRDDPGRYLMLIFFDSYESAMENSALPETQRNAAQMQSLAEGPASFRNLDVIDELPL
jgi:quinol monooxygenase YgiN